MGAGRDASEILRRLSVGCVQADSLSAAAKVEYTRDPTVLAKLIEKGYNLKCGIDFKVGYSPERVNPGDHEHTLEKIVKVVSGDDL